MEIFTWEPSQAWENARKPRVLSTKFGDGYEQRLPDGLNHNPHKFNVKFNNRTEEEIDEINSFLEARGGVEAFLWTPPSPHDVQGAYLAREWSISEPEGNIFSLYTTFEQVFQS